MVATFTGGLPGVPLLTPLSAKYKDTFAFPTIKDRCLVMLSKVIDHLHRDEQYRQGAETRSQAMVEELSKLRNEMQTNKPLVNPMCFCLEPIPEVS